MSKIKLADESFQLFHVPAFRGKLPDPLQPGVRIVCLELHRYDPKYVSAIDGRKMLQKAW